jgi:hypothetical protein
MACSRENFTFTYLFDLILLSGVFRFSLLPTGLPTEIFYAFLICLLCALCLSHNIPLDIFSLVIFLSVLLFYLSLVQIYTSARFEIFTVVSLKFSLLGYDTI